MRLFKLSGCAQFKHALIIPEHFEGTYKLESVLQRVDGSQRETLMTTSEVRGGRFIQTLNYGLSGLWL